MPDNLTEPARAVWARDEGRRRAYGHWQPIDAEFLGTLCEAIAVRERALSEARTHDDPRAAAIAFEIARETDEQIDKWERGCCCVDSPARRLPWRGWCAPGCMKSSGARFYGAQERTGTDGRRHQ